MNISQISLSLCISNFQTHSWSFLELLKIFTVFSKIMSLVWKTHFRICLKISPTLGGFLKVTFFVLFFPLERRKEMKQFVITALVLLQAYVLHQSTCVVSLTSQEPLSPQPSAFTPSSAPGKLVSCLPSILGFFFLNSLPHFIIQEI